MDDEEDVLLAFAEELPEFYSLIGGDEHVPVLLRSLETLAQIEETDVRNKAIEGIKSVGEQVSDEVYTSVFVDLIRRFQNGEWFTMKCAACGLIPSAYSRVEDDVKEEFVQLYIDLCNDNIPMVRKAAFTNIKVFFSLIC